MATINRLKPGQVVYTVTKHRLGNTMVRTTSVHHCQVLEVHDDHVIASWNGNRPKCCYRIEVKRWKLKKPVVVEGFFGSARLARKSEIEEAKKEGRLMEGGDRFTITAQRSTVIPDKLSNS